ncbi:MAG: hypothetical protein H0W50_05410 [Parachlamydiaceae bacterium]|nr:hypothetical protein [Parachlamydiaceae bacterium]
MFVSSTNSNISYCPKGNHLKRKLEEVEVSVSINCHIKTKNWEESLSGKELIQKILSYLQFEDILKFETLASNYKYLTDINWKYLKSTKFFNFDWSDCIKELHPAKDCFLLSKAIHAYIHHRSKHGSNQLSQKIYQRFEGLMRRFPSFGACLWYDIKTICPTLQSPLSEKFNEDLVVFDKAIKDYPLYGGDFLLGGLYKAASCNRKAPDKISVNKMGEIFILFKKAIELKASCASYFAVKTLGNKVSINWHYSLGALSADQKDYRALDHLMNENMNFALDIYNSGIFLPSVVGAIANNSLLFRDNNLENYKKQTKTLLENAIDCYEEANVPLYIWDKWDFLLKGIESKGHIKNSLEFFSEKQVKNSKISSNSYDGCVDLDFRTSFRKFQLGEWNEAEKWYDNLGHFVADRTNVHPLAYWIRKAYIKFQLKKWGEAEKLYDGILELKKLDEIREIPYDLYTKGAINLQKSKECNFTNNIWLDLAHIKLNMEKMDVALGYYNSLMEREFDNTYFNSSKDLYESCAYLYRQIKNHYNKINISFPFSLQVFGARISFFYRGWEDVIALLNPLYFHNSLSNKELVFLGYASLMTGNFEFAEIFYDQLKELDDIDSVYSSCKMISDESRDVGEAEKIKFWLDYVYLKIKLKKVEDAYMICYTNVIQLLLSDHINRYKSAENFLNIVLAAHEAETPPNLILSWISDLHAGKFGNIKL